MINNALSLDFYSKKINIIINLQQKIKDYIRSRRLNNLINRSNYFLQILVLKNRLKNKKPRIIKSIEYTNVNNKLNYHIIFNILLFTNNLKDIIRIRLVSKQFNNIVINNKFINTFFKNNYNFIFKTNNKNNNITFNEYVYNIQYIIYKCNLLTKLNFNLKTIGNNYFHKLKFKKASRYYKQNLYYLRDYYYILKNYNFLLLLSNDFKLNFIKSIYIINSNLLLSIIKQEKNIIYANLISKKIQNIKDLVENNNILPKEILNKDLFDIRKKIGKII